MTVRVRRAAAGLLCGLCLCVVVPRLPAIDEVRLELDAMQGQGWRTGALRARLGSAQDGTLSLRAEISALELPAPLTAVRAATVTCVATRSARERYSCPRARVALELDRGAPIVLVAALSVDAASGTLDVVATDQPLAGGRITARLRVQAAAFELDASFESMDAAVLAAAGAAFQPLPLAVSAGRVSGRAKLVRRAGAEHGEASVTIRGLTFSDATGLHAGEEVGGALSLQGRMREGGWAFALDAQLDAGAVYTDPLLLDTSSGPIVLSASGRLTPAGRLSLASASLADPAAGRLSARAEAQLWPQPRLLVLGVTLDETAIAPLYRRYLRPYAGAGLLSDLALAGRVSARLDWTRGGAGTARLVLTGVDAGDPGGRFALLGLDADLNWAADPGAPVSRVTWREAQAGSLGLGAGSLHLSMAAREARLLAPVELTVLDAQVRLARLEARALGLAEQRIEAGVTLSPLSLERLSERLAWLPLSGSIAGNIPSLVYTHQRLAAEGAVELELFGGSGTVSELSLQDPFGVVPRLRADLAVRGIDLEVLTRALSFGSIEGRLDGRVTGLVLENWQPIAFDAVLRTPENDSSRHRISQRAVDNLASLGGANAVLSSTFLRIFKEFSYHSLGLSCRLHAGVCTMGGVERAERGYYIVRGGGMPPRVDVIGFNERVDWATLLERLRAVASSTGPVVR